jgi:hypothetical protein
MCRYLLLRAIWPLFGAIAPFSPLLAIFGGLALNALARYFVPWCVVIFRKLSANTWIWTLVGSIPLDRPTIRLQANSLSTQARCCNSIDECVAPLLLVAKNRCTPWSSRVRHNTKIFSVHQRLQQRLFLYLMISMLFRLRSSELVFVSDSIEWMDSPQDSFIATLRRTLCTRWVT